MTLITPRDCTVNKQCVMTSLSFGGGLEWLGAV